MFVYMYTFPLTNSCMQLCITGHLTLFMQISHFVIVPDYDWHLQDAGEKRKKKRKPPQKLFDADAIRYSRQAVCFFCILSSQNGYKWLLLSFTPSQNG